MRKRLIPWVILLVASLLVSMLTLREHSHASDRQYGKEKMEANLVFGLRENSDDVMRNARIPIKKSRISTALMYDASRIATGVEPVFQFRDARHGILFPQATDVEFMSDSEESARIRNIQVDFKVPVSPKNVGDGEEFDAYDLAMYRYVMDMIARINAAGWQRYIDRGEPRLAGLDTYIFQSRYPAQKYVPSSSISVHADPMYRLTVDQWKQLQRGDFVCWSWHVDGMFLTLTYMRDFRSPDVPIVLGDQVSVNIKTDEAWIGPYDHDGNGSLATMRAAYQQAIPELLLERKKAEAQALAQGATILSQWKDATIAGVSAPGE